VKYLMDTDHLSIWQRMAGAEWAVLSAKVAAVPTGDVGFPIVSYHEQSLGCHAFINRAKSTADVVRGYAMLARVVDGFTLGPIAPFDVAAGAAFDGLQSLRLRIGTLDLRIASIALSRSLVLLTRNAGDFGKVPGLVIEDWTR